MSTTTNVTTATTTNAIFVDPVVDYYAIVGIGDTLEWNDSGNSSSSSHRQSIGDSSSSEQPELDSNNNTAVPRQQQLHSQQEEDRFLREIVQLRWIDTDDRTFYSTNNHIIEGIDGDGGVGKTQGAPQQYWTTLYHPTTKQHPNQNHTAETSNSSRQINARQDQYHDDDDDLANFLIFQQQQQQSNRSFSLPTMPSKLYLSYQRRKQFYQEYLTNTSTTTSSSSRHHHQQQQQGETSSNDEQRMQIMLSYIPTAVADVQLYYVQLHYNTILLSTDHDNNNNDTILRKEDNNRVEVARRTATSTIQQQRQQQKSNPATIPDLLFWKRCTTAGASSNVMRNEKDDHDDDRNSSSSSIQHRYMPQPKTTPSNGTTDSERKVAVVMLESLLSLPRDYTEWCIPSCCQQIYHPGTIPQQKEQQQQQPFHHVSDNRNDYYPKLLSPQQLLHQLQSSSDTQFDFCFIPVVAIRRQQLTDEQRYYEDTAITDIRIGMNHTNHRDGQQDDNYDATSLHHADDDDDSDFDENQSYNYSNSATLRHPFGQTKWTPITSSLQEPTSQSINGKSSAAAAATAASTALSSTNRRQQNLQPSATTVPTIYIRRNCPNGLCDRAFPTRVIGRFPYRNYNNVPLPMEEIPMFCYPKMGCTLYRTQHIDCPIPQYYGFVVKNERGENIYVSCVSFMEPLTTNKVQQMEQKSFQRRYVSIPHYQHYIRRKKMKYVNDDIHTEYKTINDDSHYSETYSNSNCLVTAFTDMTTFENKTICLVSRYPYWTAFRKFLSHLHTMASGSVPSDIPIERYISHLVLSVQLPKPGGPNVILPLPAFNTPMIISVPHEKDFPLLDLPYHRLFSCLNVKTIITVVLGLLSLERKVIILSTRPSLVLDVAELLRSLLFPFDLCAPYVPRLTEPFKSSLDFPGAIFVGIHDDNDPNGLAAFVKANYPEESTIIDLDTGEMDCDGDRYEILTSLWNLIPRKPRDGLLSELETLCRDADIVDGQEPLDSLLDSAFYVDLADAVDGNDISTKTKKQLDDRCIRDAFLRFFCSVLGGYERFLVVPDANFLISGDEWFDSPSFLASAPTANVSYLTSLVSTQLFQSFIQRRTEASDVHCMLFDECITEYHSTTVPYGRIGGDVEIIQSDESTHPQILYSLLVDQSATLTNQVFDPTTIAINRSMDASEADSSFTMNMSRAAVGSVAETSIMNSESVVSYSGDIFTIPSTQDLPPRKKYTYCIDGNPCFPHHLNPNLFLPREPMSWTITITKTPDPLLARSDKELEDANRRRRLAVSHLGASQRRCLWQLPKLMASHFLGSWLLCTPALVSQVYLSRDQQSKYLLRALGALRLLRSKHRIVPDEAAYRALIVACGRTQSDRRVELVKLFGLLRSDGIFPSAVTLGQYTKALAEGYSKRLMDTYQTEDYGFEVMAVKGSPDAIFNEQRRLDLELSLNNLDTSMNALEYHGGRWRQSNGLKRTSSDNADDVVMDAKVKRFDARIWHPVVYSSSFVPFNSERTFDRRESVRLVAIWSRTQGCANCSYVPLEEEVQSGWDAFTGKNDIPGAIACPRCDHAIVPTLGFRELSIDESLTINLTTSQEHSFSPPGADFTELPPQIRPIVETESVGKGVRYVTYICPAVLREALEHYVEEYGDGILDRDQLRDLDPEVFYNFWWYCARFSLPLPLPISADGIHMCAFASWDRSSAERGCYSAAKTIQPLLRPSSNIDFDDLPLVATTSQDPAQVEIYDDMPLLARFNLQGFYSNVWEHSDLSKLLVSLVEACDKRDFRIVIENAIECNKRRVDAFGGLPDVTQDDSYYATINSSVSYGAGSIQTAEIDVYRVVLYLAKYQCTSAFHNFFPTILKPCKGYHYWCAIGTPLPTFDRLFRDAVRRANKNSSDKSTTKIHDVSDVALAFRCVFGHLI